MNLFVSTPMTGKTADEVMQNVNLVKAKYPNDNIIFSYNTLEPPKGVVNNHLWYLGQAFQELARADKIVFTPGWEKSKGCLAEYDIALKYGIAREYI